MRWGIGMRKFKYGLIILVSVVVAGGCFIKLRQPKVEEVSTKNSISVVEESLKPVVKNVNGINVIIDPRMELLAVVQALGTYDQQFDLITNMSFNYKDDIMKYFSNFSKHEAVKQFDTMSRSGFSFDAPPTAMLYLSNPLNLEVKKDFDEELKSRATKESLNKLAKELKNFAVDTKFQEFFNSHKDFYNSVVEKNAEVIGNSNYISYLEQYYGMKQNSYNIILAPMFHSGGFGPKIEAENGLYDVYSIQGPNSLKGNIPMFGDKEGFKYLALHEFSHSFVNSLTEENMEEVNKYKKLYEPIKEKMVNQAYTKWDISVNEHIVRAVVARITYINSGSEAYEKVIANEKNRGFLYIDELTKKLEDFEKNRDKYKSFKEFYPELIKAFDKIPKDSNL